MSNLLILCSSFVIKKPFLFSHDIDLQYSQSRIDQYIEGFNALSKHSVFDLFEKNIIVDNTVQNKKDIPQDLLSAIGERPELHLFKENKLGLLNKGAGVIDSLSRIKSTAKQYDFIVYFEPKLKLIDNNFFKIFIENPTNIFYEVENYPQVKSGYFSSNSSDFLELLDYINVEEMIEKKINLENLLYDFYIDRNPMFLKGSTTVRYDPLLRKSIDY